MSLKAFSTDAEVIQRQSNSFDNTVNCICARGVLRYSQHKTACPPNRDDNFRVRDLGDSKCTASTVIRPVRRLMTFMSVIRWIEATSAGKMTFTGFQRARRRVEGRVLQFSHHPAPEPLLHPGKHSWTKKPGSRARRILSESTSNLWFCYQSNMTQADRWQNSVVVCKRMLRQGFCGVHRGADE